MRILLSIFFVCILNTLGFSQAAKFYPAEEFTSTLIQKKVGGLIVYNGTKHSYTFEIADTIRSGAKPYLMTINKKILKTNITQFQRKFDFDSLEIYFLKQNLIGTMNYLKIRDHNSRDLDKNYEFIVINDQIFLFWGCKMPASNKTTDQQFYLETICFDQIITMSTPVNKSPMDSTAVYDTNRTFLTGIGKTLKMNNYPLDLEKIRKEIKAQDPADKPKKK